MVTGQRLSNDVEVDTKLEQQSCTRGNYESRAVQDNYPLDGIVTIQWVNPTFVPPPPC